MPNSSALFAKVRVPASTSNLGPGFDCLGIALQLYNTVEVSWAVEEAVAVTDPFLLSAAQRFFEKAQIPSRQFTCRIKAEVPSSRGLGSSVTIRLGLLLALNQLVKPEARNPLSLEQIYDIVVDLEGHPDNTTPSLFGGFAVSLPNRRYLRFPVSSDLKFVLAIPATTTATAESRRVVPSTYSRQDAVFNLSHASAIAAAFASGRYELLQDLFKDRFHQPYRQQFLPYLQPAIEAAVKHGAIGAWLSGSGSTVACITTSNAFQIAEAMSRAIGEDCTTRIVFADNMGATFLT